MTTLSEYEALEQYDEYIDETTGPVILWGMEYAPSTVLKEIDPIAYRTGFSDWMDSQDIELEEDN